MKNLVLGSLLAAVTSSTACTTTTDPLPPPTDAVVTARWAFTHYADDSARSCPVNYQTTALVAYPWNPATGKLYGTPVIDKFDCADKIGTTLPLDGIYQVWVEIENDAGTNYAQSTQYFVDTADGDVSIDFEIFDDAGFFYLSWELYDRVTNQDLTCSQASAGDGPVKVATTATLAGPNTLTVDRFPCEHGFGTTFPLVAGNYTVSVGAEVSTGSIGSAPTLTNKRIEAMNGITDLGHIMIPID